MGDGFVLMHGLVKKLSNPKLIQFLEKLVEVPLEVDLEAAKPVGPFGHAVEDAERGLPAGPGGHAGADPGAGEAEGRAAGAGWRQPKRSHQQDTTEHQVSPRKMQGAWV